MNDRIYRVEIDGIVYNFRNYKKAGRFYRANKAAYASTWLVDAAGNESRLDWSGSAPEWAWNYKFKYA